MYDAADRSVRRRKWSTTVPVVYVLLSGSFKDDPCTRACASLFSRTFHDRSLRSIDEHLCVHFMSTGGGTMTLVTVASNVMHATHASSYRDTYIPIVRQLATTDRQIHGSRVARSKNRGKRTVDVRVHAKIPQPRPMRRHWDQGEVITFSSFCTRVRVFFFYVFNASSITYSREISLNLKLVIVVK